MFGGSCGSILPASTLTLTVPPTTARQPVPDEMSQRGLLGSAACALAALLIIGCSSGEGSSTPSSSPATGAPTTSLEESATPPALIFQNAFNLFNVQVPVPSGWTMSGEQSLVSLTPPGGAQASYGFSLMFVGPSPAIALNGNCGGGTPQQRVGPATLAGHAGSYETYCTGSWTALLPTADGKSTWAWDYLGATGLESGPDESTFMAVLQAFTAPSVPPKPTNAPTLTS